MGCSTPGLSVYHQLPESTQTHVHRVSDAIQPSHPLFLLDFNVVPLVTFNVVTMTKFYPLPNHVESEMFILSFTDRSTKDQLEKGQSLQHMVLGQLVIHTQK